MTHQESVIVRCAHCGAKNRIPRNRTNDHPVCGKCHNPLPLAAPYPERPLDISDQNFKNEVLNFPGPVVVFVWAPWCGHCRRLTPVVEQLATQYVGRIKFVKMLLDQNSQTGSQYGLHSVPTLLLFKGGKHLNTLVGALPQKDLERHFNTML